MVRGRHGTPPQNLPSLPPLGHVSSPRPPTEYSENMPTRAFRISACGLALLLAIGLVAGCTQANETANAPTASRPATPSTPEKPTQTPAPTTPAPAPTVPTPASVLVPVPSGPYIGHWQAIAVLIFDSGLGRFRQVPMSQAAYFEFNADGTWCTATAASVQSCLTPRPFAAEGDIMSPKTLAAGESSFRYRWRIVDQNLLVTLEQPQGAAWSPILRWVLARAGP